MDWEQIRRRIEANLEGVGSKLGDDTRGKQNMGRRHCLIRRSLDVSCILRAYWEHVSLIKFIIFTTFKGSS